MDKFSKIQTYEPEIEDTELYNSNHIKIIDYNDSEIIIEKDTVAILPYFIYEGTLLMLSEYLPAYQYKNKNSKEYKQATNYLSVITGSIEEGESIEKAIRRELYEEGGVLLSNVFNIEYSGPFFKSKRHVSQVYMCLLELNVNDYKQTKPPTDGSKSEKLSKIIKISLGDLDDIRTHDLYTQNLILMLKKDYNL